MSLVIQNDLIIYGKIQIRKEYIPKLLEIQFIWDLDQNDTDKIAEKTKIVVKNMEV